MNVIKRDFGGKVNPTDFSRKGNITANNVDDTNGRKGGNKAPGERLKNTAQVGFMQLRA